MGRWGQVIIAFILGVVIAALAVLAFDDSKARPAELSRRQTTCRVNEAGRRWNHADVKRVIRCGNRHYDPPGGVRMSLCVARNESGFGARAKSPSGTYLGVYQHSRHYWPERQRSYDHRHRDRGDIHEIADSALNARANVLVTLRMAERGGWGPWQGAAGC